MSDGPLTHLILLREVAGRLQAKVKQSTQAINRLHNLLARVFPELANLTDDLGASWVLKLLDKYPTAQRIGQARLATLQNIPYLAPELAEQLHWVAQQSVACLCGDVAETLVRDLVTQVRHTQRVEDQMRRLLSDAYTALPASAYLQVATVPGIGVATAAGLIAQTIDINRFATPAQFVGYFGVFPVEDSSGVDKFGKGRTLNKAWRSLESPTPDTAPWGHSPDIPVWRDGDPPDERGWFVERQQRLRDSQKNRFWTRAYSVRRFRVISFQHGTLCLCRREQPRRRQQTPHRFCYPEQDIAAATAPQPSATSPWPNRDATRQVFSEVARQEARPDAPALVGRERADAPRGEPTPFVCWAEQVYPSGRGSKHDGKIVQVEMIMDPDRYAVTSLRLIAVDRKAPPAFTTS